MPVGPELERVDTVPLALAKGLLDPFRSEIVKHLRVECVVLMRMAAYGITADDQF
jgi:hypothetical protein